MHIGTTSVLEFPSRTGSGRCATFVRVGLAAAIACAPVTGALAQGTQTPRNSQQRQTEAQRQPTPGRLIVPITGTLGTSATPSPTAPTGDAASKPALTGSFAIQSFAQTTEGAVAAVGTLTLSFTDPTSNAARTIVTQIAMPLAKSGDTATPGDAAGKPQTIGATPQASAPAVTQACETLSLVLGGLDLDLLGLAIQLDAANVDFIVAQGAGGRLGTLLCDVSGLIDGAAPPAELVKAMNTLLDTIG